MITLRETFSNILYVVKAALMPALPALAESESFAFISTMEEESVFCPGVINDNQLNDEIVKRLAEEEKEEEKANQEQVRQSQDYLNISYILLFHFRWKENWQTLPNQILLMTKMTVTLSHFQKTFNIKQTIDHCSSPHRSIVTLARTSEGPITSTTKKLCYMDKVIYPGAPFREIFSGLKG